MWQQDDYGLWSSPTRHTLKTPLASGYNREKPTTHLLYYKRPAVLRWYNPFEPYLGFWPIWPVFTGSFECLGLPERDLRVVMGQAGYYHLTGTIADKWKVLKDRLCRLATCIMRRNPQDQYEPELTLPELPSNLGYLNVFKHTEQAQWAASRSLSAFKVLTAFLSYLFALDMARYPSAADEVPSWLEFAVKQGQDPIFVNEIAQSFVCDFSPRTRPGICMMSYQRGYRRTIDAFVAANAPIYICWGFRPPTMYPNDHMWQWRPTHREAKDAIDRYCWDHQGRLGTDVRGSAMCWWNMPAYQTYTGPPYPTNPAIDPPPLNLPR
ncbi:hypothetical protein H0H87_012344, partial [Tephrocybe sp. NHM501043]